jgi:hypothetical protein
VEDDVTDLDPTDLDPAQLPLQELRTLRSELQALDDVVSYVRRVAQTRLDLVDAEIRHRAEQMGVPVPHEVSGELRSVLGHHLSGGPARPPRPAGDSSSHPIALEFEALCARYGVADIEGLDDEQLGELRDAMAVYEHDRSQERHALFARIDALSAELVRRYRDGEADVDGLLADG